MFFVLMENKGLTWVVLIITGTFVVLVNDNVKSLIQRAIADVLCLRFSFIVFNLLMAFRLLNLIYILSITV